MAVEPVSGESLRSWLVRSAAFMEVPAGQLAIELGLPIRRGRGVVRPVLFGIDLAPDRRAWVAAGAGLPAAAIEEMHLARYRSTALDLSRLDFASEQASMAVLKHEWGLWHRSRVCTLCVGPVGIWKLWWKLGMAAVCPLHATFLSDACPACGIRWQQGFARTSPQGLSRIRVPVPGQCGNYTGNGPCPQPVGAVEAAAAPARLAAFQQVALDAAEGRGTAIAGTDVDTSVWFTAFTYLAGAARFAVETATGPDRLVADPVLRRALEADRDRRVGANGSAALVFAPPVTAELAAAVLAVAVPILAAPGVDAAAAAAGPLVACLAAARRARSHRHSPLRAREVPSELEAVLAAAAPTAGVAAAMPRPVAAVPDFAAMPQLLDANDYRDLIAPLLPGTLERTGRRFAALALARLCGAASWPEAGRYLDFAPAQAVAAADRPGRRVLDPARFWTAIAAAAARAAQRPRVDYAARRRVLADLTAVPTTVMQPMLAPVEMVPTVMRCRHAAAWVWADLTGGDVRDAPAYRIPWAASPASKWAAVARFRSGVLPHVEAPLRTWGRERLAEGLRP
ncbi:TniQ family protein [Glycomyces sp. MUSA5-2]|uniref:TniQ family protein n=1 Tax=Glycomyces sp. MUSA5-2 TaxID=2053002 RepID=UPI00300B94E4